MPSLRHHVDRVCSAVMEAKLDYSFEFYGMEDLVRELLAETPEATHWRWLALSVERHLLQSDVELLLFGLIHDVACLAHAHARAQPASEWLERGLASLLNMHAIWQGVENPALTATLRDDAPHSWSAFAWMQLIKELDFDEMCALESTLRGLVALCIHWPGSQGLLAASMPSFSAKLKYRVLCALEVSVSTVELSPELRNLLEAMALDRDASIALQSVVVLAANARGRPSVPAFRPPVARPRRSIIVKAARRRLIEEAAVRRHGVDTVSANAAIRSRLKHMGEWLGSPMEKIHVALQESLSDCSLPPDEVHRRSLERHDWIASVSGREELFMQVVGRRRLDGDFVADGDIRLAMAVVNADDVAFFAVPTRFDSTTIWADPAALDSAHDSETELLLYDAARRSIAPGWRLLAAQLVTYSRPFSFTFTLRTWLVSGAADALRPFPIEGVPNDRSFAWYDPAAYNPHGDAMCAPLTFDAGGIRQMHQSGSELVPNVRLWRSFSWTPCAHDPFTWTREGDEVARLQKIRALVLGRHREDHPERQPLLVRWLISETEVARVESARNARLRERVSLEKTAF